MMSKFIDKVKEIKKENEKIAIFVDMDGTIAEYPVYQEENVAKAMEEEYSKIEPVNYIINILKELSKIENIDLYILTLSKTIQISEEKIKWLKKYVNFIQEKKWIIITKELGEYNKENRDFIKALKMQEKLPIYDFEILLDDDHKVLKETQKLLGNKVKVFHISSAII